MTTTARPVPSSPRANGTLMARTDSYGVLTSKAQVRSMRLTWAFVVERVTGIEPALSAWEADVLPLNYTRASSHLPRALTAEPACAVFAQTSYRTR